MPINESAALTTTQQRTIYKISPNSNLMYLPLFYKLPEELVGHQPAYLKLPRKVREVLSTEEAADLINSDEFLELVWDSYAWAIWQCIQVPDRSGNYRPIPGKWGCYSGHFPLWRLSYHIINELLRKLEAVEHWNLQALFYFKKNEEIPWLSFEAFGDMIVAYTEIIITEQNWQPMIDEIWRNRQPDDYNGQNNYKRDFMRTWTHSRTAQHISIDAILETGTKMEDEMFYDIPDPRGEFEAQVIADVGIEQFKDGLTEQDKQILQMRHDGHTLKEIAEAVGFKTPSAVSKRIEKIAGSYEDFVSDEYSDFLDKHLR